MGLGNRVGPGDKVGPENKFGPGNKVGPENKAGPGNKVGPFLFTKLRPNPNSSDADI